jgi:hypothetical protein
MQLYICCALLGVFVVGARCLMAAFYWGGQDKYTSDIGHPAHQVANLLEQVTLPMTCLACFGVGGVVATARHLSDGMVAACAFGGAVLGVVPFAVAKSIGRRPDVPLTLIVNRSGVVSEDVPAEGGGAGKVIVPMPARYVEVRAVTGGNELVSGTKVRVLGLADPTTVEVALLEDFDDIWRHAKPQ